MGGQACPAAKRRRGQRVLEGGRHQRQCLTPFSCRCCCCCCGGGGDTIGPISVFRVCCSRTGIGHGGSDSGIGSLQPGVAQRIGGADS